MSRESKYLAVACPKCCMGSGVPCCDLVGDKVLPHAARKQRAQILAKLEKTKP